MNEGRNLAVALCKYIWLLVLCVIMLWAGIFLLVDLRNYKALISGGTGSYTYEADATGTCYVDVLFQYEPGGVGYFGKLQTKFGMPIGRPVYEGSGYWVEHVDVYLDVYYREYTERGQELVYLETVPGYEYSKRYYDTDMGGNMVVRARKENEKIHYPAWRYYVPVLLLLLSVPPAALCGYRAVKTVLCLFTRKKESETPIDGV